LFEKEFLRVLEEIGRTPMKILHTAQVILFVV